MIKTSTVASMVSLLALNSLLFMSKTNLPYMDTGTLSLLIYICSFMFVIVSAVHYFTIGLVRISFVAFVVCYIFTISAWLLFGSVLATYVVAVTSLGLQIF